MVINIFYENNFTEFIVFKTNNMEVNFATHPVQGFQELNVNLTDKKRFRSF